MTAAGWTLRKIALALPGALCLLACGQFRAPAEPSVSFTRLPPFAAGSPVQLNEIAGKATGARPGQRIVLYAKSGDWWVQPFGNAPFTSVQPDSGWKNRTHPGSAYAALLVSPDFHPSLKVDTLPEKGGAVLAVAKAQSPPLAPLNGPLLLFAGYEWETRRTEGTPGGSRNDYDPANAWVDASGFLHLRIAGKPGHWTSAEVNLRRSLGYGSYRFVVRDLSHLEPAAAFTMMTWDDKGLAREMDIEVSKWGETYTKNGQFVIQPYFIPANTVQFQVPPGTVTFMLRWSPGRAAFRAFRGATANWDSAPVRDHTFTSGVPAPGDESIHMNLYVFDHNRNPLQRGSEVIVEAFEYLP